MNYNKTGLGVACLFSIIFTAFMVFYVMALSNINHKNDFLVYLPAILWGMLGVYLILNFYFSKPFRHILKSFVLILGVPISLIQLILNSLDCCRKCCSNLPPVKIFLTFPTIWAT